jgi:hypothetical protein
MLTREDFVIIAKVLKDEKPTLQPEAYGTAPAWYRGAYDEWNTIRLAFTKALHRNNPAFDVDKFSRDCGV